MNKLIWQQAIGGLSVCAFFVGIAVWAAFAEVAQGVHAPASVVVPQDEYQLELKHSCKVAGVLVRDFEFVEGGQVLAYCDTADATYSLGVFKARMADLQSRLERLQNEFDESTDGVTDRSANTASVRDGPASRISENRVSMVRERSLSANLEIINQRILQIDQREIGLSAYLGSLRQQVALIKDELEGLEGLYEQGLVRKTRVLSLRRTAAQLDGQIGEVIASLAELSNSRLEAEQQKEAVRFERLEQVYGQLTQTQAEIDNLTLQIRELEEQLATSIVTAPHNGYVMGLEATVLGEIVPTGTALLSVVPVDQGFLLEARIPPAQIEKISRGSSAEIRFTFAGGRKANQRVPLVHAEVIDVSPDAIRDQEGVPKYYKTFVKVKQEEFAKIEDHEVRYGMKAEVLFSTGNRSVLRAIVDPIAFVFERGFAT